MENLVLLTTFTLPHEAHIACSYLESEGIETILQNELTVQVNNFYSNAIGGVKVLVKESDAERGVALLIEGGFVKPYTDTVLNEIEPVMLTKDTNQQVCPFCQSANIGRKKVMNLKTILGYILIGVFFPFYKKTYVCFDCDKKWIFRKRGYSVVVIIVLTVFATSCQSRISNIEKTCDFYIPKHVDVTRDEYQDMFQDYCYYYDFNFDKEAGTALTESIRYSRFYKPYIQADSLLSDSIYVKSDDIKGLWIKTSKGYRFLTNDNRHDYSINVDTIKGCAAISESSD